MGLAAPLVEVELVPEDTIVQWSPNVGLQMFLDFNSQKSWPAEVMVKASGSCSKRTSGVPRLGTTAISHDKLYFLVPSIWKSKLITR